MKVYTHYCLQYAFIFGFLQTYISFCSVETVDYFIYSITMEPIIYNIFLLKKKQHADLCERSITKFRKRS